MHQKPTMGALRTHTAQTAAKVRTAHCHCHCHATAPKADSSSFIFCRKKKLPAFTTTYPVPPAILYRTSYR